MRIVGRHLISGDDGIAIAIGVIDEKVAIIRVVGMEDDAQQPAFPATADEAGDVQEWLGHDLAIVDDADLSRLLDDEEAAAAVTGVDDLHWLLEAIGHELDAKGKDA